jgi:hypothetical protein
VSNGVLEKEGKGRMANKARSLPRTALWIISSYQDNRMDVLTIELGGEEALPVFSFKEELETFLRLWEVGFDCWQARESTAGELISVLYGPCAQVRRVLLDPLPLRGGEETMLHLVSLGWEEFVRDFLMGETTKERLPSPTYTAWDFADAGRRETLSQGGAKGPRVAKKAKVRRTDRSDTFRYS